MLQTTVKNLVVRVNSSLECNKYLMISPLWTFTHCSVYSFTESESETKLNRVSEIKRFFLKNKKTSEKQHKKHRYT